MAALVGDYFIYKNVAGEKLAITFHEVQKPLTVQTLDSSDTQKVTDNYRYLQWTLIDTGTEGLRAIVPLKDTMLQACWGDDQSVSICPAATYLWVITEAVNDYTIADRFSTAQWGLTTGSPDEKITLEGLNGAPPTQRWIFEKVATQ